MTNLPRHPIKRFEPTLRKFQVAIPADLSRLQQHKINMEKASFYILLENLLLEVKGGGGGGGRLASKICIGVMIMII